MDFFVKLFMFFLAVSMVFLSACTCADNEEPSLSLIFVNVEGDTIPSPYQRIYGIGGNGDLAKRTDETYPFAISVVKDTMVYVFESAIAEPDTLTLSTSRSMAYDSDKCGFEIYFGYPRLVETQSTFAAENVEIIAEQYDGPTAGFVKILLP